MDRADELTVLLRRAADGDQAAFDRAVEVTYANLEPIARKHVRLAYGPRAGDATLEPSALVNEAFLRLREQHRGFANRDQFYAIATRVIVRALRDHERRRRAEKRGGDRIRVTLSGLSVRSDATLTGAVDLADALDELEQLDERKAAVVRLRVLWGQTVSEVAETLGVSVPTVERDWRFARVWLQRRLAPGASES